MNNAHRKLRIMALTSRLNQIESSLEIAGINDRAVLEVSRDFIRGEISRESKPIHYDIERKRDGEDSSH